MCGIFGVLTSAKTRAGAADVRALIDGLFRLSESRGREAAGLAALTPTDLIVFKEPITASAVLKTQEYAALFHRIFSSNGTLRTSDTGTAILGHSRLVTNGLEMVHENNQPVVSGGFAGVHNGIVVNERSLWETHRELARRSEVDTEVIFQLLRKRLGEDGDLASALGRTYQEIYGETTIAAVASDLDCVVLGTNTGSLYTLHAPAHGVLVFASESFILQRLHRQKVARALFDGAAIRQIAPRTGWIVDLPTLEWHEVAFDATQHNGRTKTATRAPRDVSDVSPRRPAATSGAGFPNIGTPAHVPRDVVDNQRRRRDAIAGLRRCTKCVLPDTMPFISFDSAGVCSYCRHYDPIQLRGTRALESVLDGMRKGGGKPDILMTFSGGRDSSYGLHYLVRHMGMRPIAYTYDWGMVTDLARRNQARLCGALGIEHIWVSADIRTKRANIRKNVTAWLRRPDLGMVPLFMAGDKQFFYYANRVREQTDLGTVVLCENLLEKTSFKSGFCGVAPSHGTKSVYSLSMQNKARMLGYYGSRYLSNPGYLNASLLDTISAYASYYVIKHDFLSLFQYIEWNEREIESVLIDEYDWETAPDTRSTWRIGDGTAPFYNYIYHTVAGFTENDTFRSNQIREGKMARADALQRVMDDNMPRYDSLKWYCDIIGIDYVDALRRIHEIRPLYGVG